MLKQRRGELAIFLACLFYTSTTISVRLLAANFSGLFISLFRFCIGIVLVAVTIIALKESFRIHQLKYWALRGIFGAAAMTLFYLCIQTTSSGRATLLAGTYPFFVALFGALFFKERLRGNSMLALVLCVAGLVLIFHDHSRYSLLGNAMGLCSGILSGFAVHFIKKAREGNHPMNVYLSACLFGLPLCVSSAPEALHITPWSLGLLLIMAVCTFIGQILASYGFKYTTATRGSIIGLAEIPLTIFCSLFLGEEMRPRFVAGTIVILAGLLVNQTVYTRKRT